MTEPTVVLASEGVPLAPLVGMTPCMTVTFANLAPFPARAAVRVDDPASPVVGMEERRRRGERVEADVDAAIGRGLGRQGEHQGQRGRGQQVLT